MGPRSNIGVSLNKKRQTSFLKKIGAYFVFILFFLSLGVLGLTTDNVRIKNVIVSGNHSVPTENIMRIVNEEMNKYYLVIIPTNNILLLRRNEIKNGILDSIKEIGHVEILMQGIDKIEIFVTERESKYLWCQNKPLNSENCYFMDAGGFVFEEAPTFSANTFSEYFGLITEKNPIGQYYLKDNFKSVTDLYKKLQKMSFQPKYFNALSENEYEVYILGGGKILINNSKSFDSSLINLQALVDSGYIKNDTESLNKIKYIDLRFGNKVNFELVK